MIEQFKIIKADVAVLGAGVLGVSLAYHLGKLGCNVAIIERECLPGMHASGKNAGMIRQLYRHPQLTDWANRSISLWPREIKNWAFSETGSLIVGRDAPSHHTELFSEENFTLENKQTVNAVRTKSDGLLDSPAYMNALYLASRSARVKYFFNKNILNLERTQSSWIINCADDTRITADYLVNACGAWVNELSSSIKTQTQAYARHLFLISGWQRGFMPAADCGFFWDEYSNWYMRLWSEHERLVSVCEKIPASPETYSPSGQAIEDVSQRLIASFPGLASQLAIKRSWHCFRTYTTDQLPLWGPDANHSGLFWLAAFGGFGMSTSFAACYDAAMYLTGRKITVSADVFPSRLSSESSIMGELQKLKCSSNFY